MFFSRSVGAGLLALVASTFAAPAELTERDSTCTNGPTTRNCWKSGYSVATNSDTKFPDTGVTRTVRRRS
jgi:hypothetical protein